MYRTAARGETVPELGSVNGVPGLGEETAGAWSWSSLVSTIGKAVEVGGTVYDKYINPDEQNAQLEIAKLQAKTEAERLAIAQLQARTAAGGGGGGSLLGIGAGTLALLAAGGLALFFVMKKRR